MSLDLVPRYAEARRHREESVRGRELGPDRRTVREMGRARRVQVAGGFFHITALGNRRQPIFLDVIDREKFLLILGDVVFRWPWVCHAYCLLTTHYHLVVETPEQTLSRGMHGLNRRYAQWFNERHDLEGHVFQAPFGSVLIQDDEHLETVARYVALNPVRAGVCGRPEDWEWSSYAATIGLAPIPFFLTVDGLLGLFSRDIRRARRVYEDFVLEDTNQRRGDCAGSTRTRPRTRSEDAARRS
jgi:REP-associated tyrosine transposase